MKISSTVTRNSHFDVAFAQAVPLVSKTKAGCYLSLREKQDAEKLAACLCSQMSGAILVKTASTCVLFFLKGLCHQ
jgi:hypothetical protein